MTDRLEQVKNKYKEVLHKYLPENVLDTVCDWILHYNFNLKITESRRTKLGDYTSPSAHSRHQITINHDLNPYNFFITLVHEIAHLSVYNNHKEKIRNIKPHGTEWKHEFKKLIHPFLNEKVFPQDVLQALVKYMHNPAASSCSDIHLLRILKKYDNEKKRKVYLEELPPKSIFRLGDNRLFEKGLKKRVRFVCLEINTKRTYLVHPLAEVEIVQQAMF